jgi:hypothetical protein
VGTRDLHLVDMVRGMLGPLRGANRAFADPSRHALTLARINSDPCFFLVANSASVVCADFPSAQQAVTVVEQPI